MAPESIITDELRAAIGVETEPWTLEVEKGFCRLFARAVGHTDPIFYDEGYALSQGYRSIAAPPGYLGTPVYTPDRPPPPIGLWRFDLPYKRLLAGGTEIQQFDTICAGDTLTATSKIVEANERQGSIGPMLIALTETTYRNRQGSVVAIVRATQIKY